MGYTTNFRGQLTLNKKLSEEDHEFLTKFSQSRRMARNVDPKYGVEGEFYVDGTDDFFTKVGNDVIDYNRPPKTQPSLWCQWIPNKDGTAIEWDGEEKFYHYIEWLEYLIEKILEPRGYVLNGIVEWYGEEWGDNGTIIVRDNIVEVV